MSHAITQRTEMIYGEEAMKKLRDASVILFGVGGVGSWCAESLVRSGIGNLTIVDSDTVCLSNVNRQVEATSHNEGKVKVNEMAGRLKDINPELKINALHEVYNADSAESFGIPSFSCAVDAIDSVSNKIHLIEYCSRNGVYLVSSMGAASKRDPSHIKFSTIEKTAHCPLARTVRRELKKRGVSLNIPCVYSDESPLKQFSVDLPENGSDDGLSAESRDGMNTDRSAEKKRINGAVVHITAIFGFMLSYLVIEHILETAIT